MIDEKKLREQLLTAAAQRHAHTAYGDQLQDVLAGRMTLRGFAEAEGVAQRLMEHLDAAMQRYAQHGDEDVEAVQRTFDPDLAEERGED
jgi:hypothetical protein